MSTPADGKYGEETQARRSLLLLIIVTFVLRVIWAACLETGQDEAYHYLYTVHPDWSYFDHPAMLMYVARFGVLLFGGWVHPLSVRIGFILMFAGSTWILYRWTARWFGAWAGFYAAMALNVSAYNTAIAGAFVLPDGPLLFFSLLTMWRLGEALVGSPGKVLPWLGVGFACAGAMQSKYFAVFLPLAAVGYVLVTPSARRQLLTPGPYLASVIGFLGVIPILIWNSQHDWASIAFQSSRGMGQGFRISGLVVMFFGPIGLLLPWIWVPMMQILVTKTYRFRTSTGIERLLLCQSLVPLILLVLIFRNRAILPHWPLIGFIPLYPLLGASWAQRAVTRPVSTRRWLQFMSWFLIVVATAFVAQARLGVLPLKWDPCLEISGWESVAAELDKRHLVDRPDTFIFTESWFNSGQIAFATRNRIPVTCYREGDARGFAFWSRPDDWVGKDGILLDFDPSERTLRLYEPYFREIVPQPSIQMTRGGHPFRTVHVYLCHQQLRPFPFAYQPRTK